MSSKPTMVLNDQGGEQMSITYDVTNTLRSQMKHHEPIVFSAGFSYGQSDKASLAYQDELSPTIRGGEGGNERPCLFEVREAVPIENHPNDSRAKICEDGIVQTLSGRMGTGGNNTPLVMEMVIPFDTTQITSPMNYSHPKPGDPCHPLAATAHPPVVAYGIDQQGGKGGANYSEEVCPPILSDSHGTPHAVAFTQNQREEVRDLGDVATAISAESGTHQQTYVATCIGNGQGDIASHISRELCQTLNCMHDQLAVFTAYGFDAYNQEQYEELSQTLREPIGGDNTAKVVSYGIDRASYNQGKNAQFDFSIEDELAPTCVSRGPGGVCTSEEREEIETLDSNGNEIKRERRVNTVRRLTPLECERLQAFPDFWTDIGEWTDSKGKKHSPADTPRYKALGNSIALPYWDWLLGRISAEYDEDYTPTLGSLFDGIGGFPLCWEHHNGRGTALWASEIEEFPIAVTKLRFPEPDEYTTDLTTNEEDMSK